MGELGADYSMWLKADLWTIERAILLLINAETLPSRNYYSSGRCNTLNEQDIYDDFMKIWTIAESSLIAGTLKRQGKSYPSVNSQVLPSDYIQWAESKGFQMPDELKAIGTASQAENLGEVGKSSHAGAEPKPKGKNEKRMDILNEWYGALCLKHQNDIEVINQEIDDLTNEKIKTELANITLKGDKHIWINGADRWIMDKGKSVWQFKRTQGRKSKKSYPC